MPKSSAIEIKIFWVINHGTEKRKGKLILQILKRPNSFLRDRIYWNWRWMGFQPSSILSLTLSLCSDTMQTCIRFLKSSTKIRFKETGHWKEGGGADFIGRFDRPFLIPSIARLFSVGPSSMHKVFQMEWKRSWLKMSALFQRKLHFDHFSV